MDVHALEYLLMIAETGSVSAAAEQAHLSQPAMTQCLAKLEKQAGWPLFNRVNRRLVPTRAGEIYLDGAREMVQIKNDTYREIEQLRLRRNCLKVTGSAEVCRLLTEKVLPPLHHQFPMLQVELAVTTTYISKQYLANGLSDISFLCFVQPSSLLEYTELFQETLCLAVPKKMVTDEIRSAGLSACNNLPFILPDEHQFGRELVDRVLRRERVYPLVCYTAESWGALSRMADADYGAALLPTKNASNLKNCEVFSLIPPPVFSFACATARYTEPTPEGKALIELAIQEFSKSE